MRIFLATFFALSLFTASAQTPCDFFDPAILSVEQVDVSNQIMCFVGCAVGYEIYNASPDATITWDFGNGASSTGNDAYLESYTCYNEPGTYTVVATMTCPTGDTYLLTHLAVVTCGWDPVDIPGCMYEPAINYNPAATIDDGSCEFTVETACSGDINGDALVSIDDILILLAQFGFVCD